MEEEIEEIEQKILPLNTEFDNAQRFAFEFESQYNNSEKLLEKWRKTTLKAMEDAKLLSHFHLSLNSNMEELVIKFYFYFFFSYFKKFYLLNKLSINNTI